MNSKQNRQSQPPAQVPAEFAFPGRANRPSKRQRAKSGLYIRSAGGLKLRSRRVQRIVRSLRLAMPYLQDSDVPTCRAWAELEILGATAFAILDRAGLISGDGNPRRLLGDYLRLRSVQIKYAETLGMSPAARQAIRASSTNAALDLAQLMAQGDGDGEEEVVAEGTGDGSQ